MIERKIKQKVIEALKNVPVVAILGPRQVGKTTLAFQILNERPEKESIYGSGVGLGTK